MNKQTSSAIDATDIASFWDREILPALSRYIEIPNQSPLYDPEWRTNGHLQNAVELIRDWIEKQQIAESRVAVFEGEGRTPLIMLEVDGEGEETVLLYGHLDKQPPMEPWAEGLGPWTPVVRDGKLYGRGGADDGYAAFAAVAAIKALQQSGLSHPRLVLIIEACEESGSYDLPYYVDLCAARIGTPGLVVCLDSGCGNYEQLWATTSLRGSVVGNLTIRVLKEGVHSGDASGIVPSSFRILRIILDRLEDSATGDIRPEWLSVEIPQNRIEETRKTAKILGDAVFTHFPFIEGMRAVSDKPEDLLLNRSWRPALSITGQGGMPELAQSGNVLRPLTAVKISLRVPPTLDADEAGKKLKSLFESDPPYGAEVTFEYEKGGTGWDAPPPQPWLEKSINEASNLYFGKPAAYLGEGGSIPFMGMLGARFPEAQFLITGVLGPNSNAHGPNEFLHLQMGKNITACIGRVISDFHSRNGKRG